MLFIQQETQVNWGVVSGCLLLLGLALHKVLCVSQIEQTGGIDSEVERVRLDALDNLCRAGYSLQRLGRSVHLSLPEYIDQVGYCRIQIVFDVFELVLQGCFAHCTIGDARRIMLSHRVLKYLAQWMLR